MEIRSRHFALAVAVVCTGIYLICVLATIALPRETAVRLGNLLLHGIDVAPVMRWDISWSDTLLGALLTSVAGWLSGSVVAGVYNLQVRREAGRKKG